MAAESQPLAGDLIRAVEVLSEVLADRSIRYALVGGLATTMRGRPRFTQDVDILLEVTFPGAAPGRFIAPRVYAGRRHGGPRVCSRPFDGVPIRDRAHRLAQAHAPLVFGRKVIRSALPRPRD